MNHEEAMGALWRLMAKKEGHKKKFPPTLGLKFSPRTQRVMDYLKENPNKTSRHLSEILELNIRDANATLNRLAKGGQVKRYKGGDSIWLYYV